jgi:hypothetical protein
MFETDFRSAPGEGCLREREAADLREAQFRRGPLEGSSNPGTCRPMTLTFSITIDFMRESKLPSLLELGGRVERDGSEAARLRAASDADHRCPEWVEVALSRGMGIRKICIDRPGRAATALRTRSTDAIGSVRCSARQSTRQILDAKGRPDREWLEKVIQSLCLDGDRGVANDDRRRTWPSCRDHDWLSPHL